MEKQEAINKLEQTVGAYLLSGQADDTTCGEWREILETLRKEPCKVTEYDRDHIWYKGLQYISLNRFIEIAKKQKPCEDAISRADANKLVDELARAIDDQNRHYPKRGRDIAIIARDIERLPRVTPIREHGKWIRVDDTKCKCSKCEITHFIAQYPHGKVDFCPNCGADMRKEQNNV